MGDVCAFMTPIMPDLDSMLPADLPEMEREMMRGDMEKAMEEAMRNMPPLPKICADSADCGNMQSHAMIGEYILGCNGKGMEGMEGKEGKEGMSGKDDDEDRRGDGGSYIEMTEDFISAKIKISRDIEMMYENDMRGNLKFETETGPVRTRTRMERGEFDMEANMGDMEV